MQKWPSASWRRAKREKLLVFSNGKDGLSKHRPRTEPPQYPWQGELYVAKSSKRSFSIEWEATDFLRRPTLVFYGAVGISSTLGYVAPSDNTLNGRFCGRSNRTIQSLKRLTVADYGSSARAEARLVCFRMTRVAGRTFLLMTGTSMDADAVEVINVSTDWIPRCCRRLLFFFLMLRFITEVVLIEVRGNK